MKTIKVIVGVICCIIFMNCFGLLSYARMPQDIKPGQFTDTVVWETSLKPVTGRDEALQIVCLNGVVNEDTYDKGRITSTVGDFEIRLIDSLGETISSNDSLFDFEMKFYFTNFKLIYDDYNNDGYVDFALGQTVVSRPGGWVYKIYTIKDNTIQELPVKNQPYIFISGGGNYYRQLNKSLGNSLLTVEYEGYQPRDCIIKTYQWDGKQFYLSNEETRKLVSDKNKYAVITSMSFWPEYGISLYSTNEPLIGGYKGYRGYYLYVRGEEKYFPDWESEYPIELQSIIEGLEMDIFAVNIVNGSGTSVTKPTIISFNAETMSVIDSGPQYYYFNPPTNDKAGQFVFSGGAFGDDRTTDILIMINGEIVSDVNAIVYGDIYVPLYQINDKLGIALNQSKNNVRWQIFDGVAYATLESVAEAISAEFGTVNNFEPDRGIYYPYDLAWIDTKINSDTPIYNQDTVVKYAKDKLIGAFEKYYITVKETYKFQDTTFVDNTLTDIKARIDDLKYLDSFSRFIVLDGPYRMLVDVYTGEIYFQQWSNTRSWISKVNFNDFVSFDLNYFYD